MMAGTARALVVVCLIVSAGCVGLSGESLSDQLAGYTGDPDNPYPDANLTVTINATHTERAFAPLVRQTFAYWETHDERYLNYTVNFTLAPNATDPDLRVSFVPAIERCGEAENAAGCSPQVTNPAQAAGTVGIRVLDNLSARSTVRVLEHEFGHALGLGHGDAPQSLMRTHTTLTTLPQPDATERQFAWDDPTLTVFVEDDASAADHEQIDHALDYYDRGAAGTVPKTISFRYVENPAQADIVVRFSEHSSCGFDTGSCGSVFGTDADGDGALEQYSRLEITLSDLDSDAVGWHVARWLGLGFGFEDESEYPPVLRDDTSQAERRSDWWE
jgi:hypothetical protein